MHVPFFNLSHTTDRGVMLAVSPGSGGGGGCGMRAGFVVSGTGLRRVFFGGNEAVGGGKVAEEEIATAFFTCWTRKEAVLKGNGRGISFGLGQI